MARIELPQRGLHLEYESHGSDERPAVILVMGLGMQLVSWPPALVDALVDAGYRVIAFDNRDIGLSGSGPLPAHYTRPQRALLAYLLHQEFTPAYRIADMAADTLALADALRIDRFDIVGASLGGMIGQSLAARSERVRSLVSIMSSAGPRTTPWPSPALLWRFLQRPPKDVTLDVKLAHFVGLMRALGNITDPDELAALRARLTLSLQRSYNPAGVARQLMAVLADPDRSAEVARIRCPTLIIHAADDPLVPLPAAYHLAHLLPQARLEVIQRMGHYLPASALPEITRLTIDHLRAAGDAQASARA
ncbi:MAG TPA: alpha/beta fold hydrolase [Rudaea sp.]|nr:alpha/beta fold hydrolase [Rudaea sp.]